MGRVQKPFSNMVIRQKTFKSEEGLKKSMGIMFGSRIEQRKYRKITFRVRGNEHIQIITVVKAVSGRIPSNITVRL